MVFNNAGDTTAPRLFIKIQKLVFRLQEIIAQAGNGFSKFGCLTVCTIQLGATAPAIIVGGKTWN